jgi:hypothetical protein
LTDDKKLTRFAISRYLLSRYDDEPDLIYRIVLRDETRVHHFNPESKKTQHAVQAPWLIYSEESQESAVSKEDDCFNVLRIVYLEQGRINGMHCADDLRRLRQ